MVEKSLCNHSSTPESVEIFIWGRRSRAGAPPTAPRQDDRGFLLIISIAPARLYVYIMYLLWLTTRNRATKPEELGPFAWSAVLVPRTVPPPPPFDSLIDTVMLVPPIMVVHFNETSILEYDPPANVQETPRRRTRGKNKLIGGKLARKFSSLPRVNFISFEYLIFLRLSNIKILLII